MMTINKILMRLGSKVGVAAPTGALVSLIAGCGAGYSSEDSPATAPDPVSINNPPSIVVEEYIEILEGVVEVTEAQITDSDSAGVINVTLSGDDATQFIFSDGQLKFKYLSDYEAPTDEDLNNSYELSIVASDGVASTSVAVTVSVLDAVEGRVIDGPVADANLFVDLNADLVPDLEEASGQTNDFGYYAVQRPETDGYLIIAADGIDSMTGNSPGLVLIAPSFIPAESNIGVNGLTSMMISGQGSELDDLITSLGVPYSAAELLSMDFWYEAEVGSEIAKQIQRLNSQIINVIAVSTSIATAEPVSEPISVKGEVLNGLSTSLLALSDQKDAVDLSVSENIEQLLTGLPIYQSLDSDTFDGIVTAISDLNVVLGDLGHDPVGSDYASIISVLQIEFRRAVGELIRGEITTEIFLENSAADSLLSSLPAASMGPNNDGDLLSDPYDPDDDNDGTRDSEDFYPFDPSEVADTDGDGVGDNADAFPLDPLEQYDLDGDGIGNNADTDDDGDGVPDLEDPFPLDPSESVDTDGDGIGNNEDTDDDNDGASDIEDAFPLDASETTDTDQDGVGNNEDTDDDGDGVPDTVDAAPLDNTLALYSIWGATSWEYSGWTVQNETETVWGSTTWENGTWGR